MSEERRITTNTTSTTPKTGAEAIPRTSVALMGLCRQYLWAMDYGYGSPVL
jgi:hypothetical protein